MSTVPSASSEDRDLHNRDPQNRDPQHRDQESRGPDDQAARSAGGTRSLAREAYVSEEVFAREQELIFGRRWQYAAHVSEIAEPGRYLTLEPTGGPGHESVLLLRDQAAAPRAFFNVCRHRGSQLCRDAAGVIPGKIVCPYHSWSYDLDGRLLHAPNMDGVDGFEPEDYPLVSAPLRTWQGLLFVAAQTASPTDAPSTEDAFSRLDSIASRWNIAALQVAARKVYDVEANWKTLFQNYSECYHCPTAHPLLNRLSPYRDSSSVLREGAVLGGFMRMARAGGSMTLDGQRCAPPLPGLDPADLDRAHYYTLFPNLFLSLAPDYVLVHRIEPLAVARTRVTCDWLFHPDAIAQPGFDPSPAVEFWDLTNLQDWELCAGVQRGVASRAYVPGPYSELESEVAAFDRQYQAAMADS